MHSSLNLQPHGKSQSKTPYVPHNLQVSSIERGIGVPKLLAEIDGATDTDPASDCSSNFTVFLLMVD
jgi:hypothetical protein